QKGNYAAIDVDGTLYIQTKKTGIKTVSATSITSDVVSEGTNDVRYTNLASAIINAGSSDVVIKLSNNVTVSSDMTIPSNVIINMDGKTFTVSGAKLTIDGALFIGNNNANFSIADVTEPLLKKASIVVNGMIASTDNIAYDGAKFPAGAYYSVKYQNVNYNVITSAVKAPEVINDAQDQTVGLYGTNKVSDLDFAGTDKPVYILVKGDLVAGIISIDNAYVIFDNGKKVTATISNGEDSFSLKDVLINANNTTFGSYNDDDDVYHFAVNGSFNVQSGKDSTYGFIVKGDVEIAGATFAAITDSKYYSVVVDGTAVITASSALGDALINGSLIINNGVNASATDVTVNGSIEAKIATEESPSEGSLSISGKLYAGLTAAGTTGAVPTITGNVTAKTSYVVDGTVVPNSIAKATGVKTTAYVVEGVSWMTVYTTDSTLTIASVSKAPVENAVLTGWIGEDGKTKATTEKVGAEGFTTVTSKINYYIYDVVIVGDAGIGSISIDGIVLVKGGQTGENLFVLPTGTHLKAGEHKVTYVLKDGYEGTPVLYKDGTSTGGVTFSVSGKTTVGSPEYYTLSGTTAIEITPIQPTEKEDTGMG
ncbi:MAG: hypothetical protein IJX35_00900, partial [Candidatus Methanomethylophilaceae archaeon]|nr:hypothetical protein [Candidatus Methanomethylophilaceae archaeon]